MILDNNNDQIAKRLRWHTIGHMRTQFATARPKDPSDLALQALTRSNHPSADYSDRLTHELLIL